MIYITGDIHGETLRIAKRIDKMHFVFENVVGCEEV